MTFNKIYAWFCIILGILAFIGGFTDEDVYGIVGGLMFALAGIIILEGLGKIEEKDDIIKVRNEEISTIKLNQK